jgi:exonuclease VII large subunit
MNAESRIIADAKYRIENIMSRQPFRQPLDRIYQSRMAVDITKRSLVREISAKVVFERTRVDGLILRLNSLNPHSILSRGYCIAYREGTNKLIKSVEHVYKNDKINIQFIDGKASCEVVNLKKGNRVVDS